METTTSTTDLQNEVDYLKIVIKELQNENTEFKKRIQTDWLISLDFYIMARRLVLNTVDEYKLYAYPFIIDGLKLKLKLFDSEMYCFDTKINYLRLQLIETIKESISECENYERP